MAKHRLKFFGLKGKLVSGIVLAGFLVGAAASYVGYYQFTAVLERQYNDSAYNVAATACTYVDGDRLDDYLRTGQKDEAYYKTQQMLDTLTEKMECTFIYVAKVDRSDYQTLTYIYDALPEDSSFTRYELGYTAKDIDSTYVNNVRQVMETGKRVTEYCYSYSKDSGAHTTAGVPVYDSGGGIVAFLGVEKAMTALEEARTEYLEGVAVATIFAVAVFSLLHISYLRQKMIRPILTIVDEAYSFVQKETLPSVILPRIQSGDEIETLAGAVYQMEKDINSYIDNLTKVMAEKERIGTELKVATQIQADMLPRIFPYMPERGEFDLYASMEPAKEVGGDFYDYFMVDDEHLAIVIGDVSGKGVPAALFMVISKTIIKNYVMMGLPPEEVFCRTNNDLCAGNEAELFTTAWLGIYEVSTGKIFFTEAGHDLPVIGKPDGTFEYVKPVKKKMVLAAMEGIPYVVSEAVVNPGEFILLYTDGVVEATNGAEELFGQKRLEESVLKCVQDSPRQLIEQIRVDIDAFVGDAPQFDDITMLALKNTVGEQER